MHNAYASTRQQSVVALLRHAYCLKHIDKIASLPLWKFCVILQKSQNERA